MKDIKKEFRLIQHIWIIVLLLALYAGFFLVSPAVWAFTFTTIDFPAAVITEAQGINPAGQIVGEFELSGKVIGAFLRDKGGAFTTIDVPGSDSTGAEGINPSGDIVGFFAAAGATHGFLASP